LYSIKGKLDNIGDSDGNAGSRQLMACINKPTGRICSWGIPLAEAYGVRLPKDFSGNVPEQMILMDVPKGKYIVFEHGPFDFKTENANVEAKVETAIKVFNYNADGYQLDLTSGKVFYFYHDCERFFKTDKNVQELSGKCVLIMIVYSRRKQKRSSYYGMDGINRKSNPLY